MRPFPTTSPLRIPNQGRVEEPEPAEDKDSHGDSVSKEDDYSRPGRGLNTLPSEILLQIIEDFATDAPPSLKKFTLEPSTLIELAKGDEEHPTLKSLSCVSKRFRALTLPFLFQFVKLRLEAISRWARRDGKLLQHLEKHRSHLNHYERSVLHELRAPFLPNALTSDFVHPHPYPHIPVHSQDTYLTDGYLTHDANEEVVRGDSFVRQLPRCFTAFAAFVERNNLRRRIQSLTLISEFQEGDQNGRPVCVCSLTGSPLTLATENLWLQLFNVLDPLRVVIAAPPTTMGVLLQTCGQTEQQWAFDMKMHYFEVRMGDPSLDMLSHFYRVRNRYLQEPTEVRDGTLLNYKCWTHFVFNEGASIPVYHTYEYHHKESPKHLQFALLKLSNFRGPIPIYPLQSFHFVGIFPLAGDFSHLLSVLSRIPTLRRLTVQLAPGPEQDSAAITRRIGRCQPQSLWLEWDQCYRELMEVLISDMFEDGTVFTAVDCWDPRMEDEINQRVDHIVQTHSMAWIRVAKGVWVRDRTAFPVSMGDDFLL